MTENIIENPNRYKNFWLIAGLLVILLATSMSRDIFRPFYGLHSWAEAHSSWAARVHVKYGLGYTKGFSVRAVGDTIPDNPYRYLDHPQTEALVSAFFMKIFGINEWALRIVNIFTTSITLLLLILIVRGICDDKTALLSGLIFCFFPIMAYFGVHQWLYVFAVGSIYTYLILIDEIKPYFKNRKFYLISFIICSAMAIQFSWEGYFFAIGIGLHYVLKCILSRTKPSIKMLAILIFVPNLSLLLVFVIMAAGLNWDIKVIYDLFMWRASTGEMQQHNWSAWFDKLWEFMLFDYTLPVMIIAILYITIGQLFVFMESKDPKTNTRPRQFPNWFLFLVIPVIQLFVLKGCLWRHQTWIRPFSLFIAIAGAQGILLLADMASKINVKVSKAVVTILIFICLIFSIKGTNYAFNIRWQAPEKIEMFKKLNAAIPADKKLLSFEDFIVNQHKAKGAFYRPEIAWYLDRDIDTARTLDEIQEKAKTGDYSYYLIPLAYYDQQTTQYLNQMANQLRQIYKYEYIPGSAGKQTDDGKFLQAGMSPYMIFDLRSKVR